MPEFTLGVGLGEVGTVMELGLKMGGPMFSKWRWFYFGLPLISNEAKTGFGIQN